MIKAKYGVAVTVAAGFLFGASLAVAQHEPTKGSSVTLTSCVEKAQKDKTYVLTHVADVPAHPATHGGRIVYWLDKDTADKLGKHVGHQIRVVGTVSDVEKSEMEVKVNDGGMIVEIEGPGRDVRTTPENAGVTRAGRQNDKNDVKTTLVKLKVDRLDMVADKCLLAK